jgi:hypothetical protein
MRALLIAERKHLSAPDVFPKRGGNSRSSSWSGAVGEAVKCLVHNIAAVFGDAASTLAKRSFSPSRGEITGAV